MSTIERYHLSSEHEISRVLKGGWQLAGGHGSIRRQEALDDMRRFVESGITTFDCADIYTGVEELIGEFLRRERQAFASGDLPRVQVHTKYVPDLGLLADLTEADTRAIIDRSLSRLGFERLDLVQFHWWNYDVAGYVETAQALARLQQAGKIKHIAVTNFDVPHLQEILDAGVRVVSCQVQYSVLDQRPRRALADLCAKNDMRFLCYGTVAGGFLSDRYLAQPEPAHPLENRSLTKYKLIIDDLGGWDYFQALLGALRRVADRYGVSIAAVASRYVLKQPLVAGVVIGARHAGHLEETRRLFEFDLDAQDLADIDAVIGQSRGLEGGVYELERAKGGRHASIMKYNLNRE